MSHLTVLRSYAQKRNPATLPASLLFSHTDTSLTIFDGYPKSIFHFLVLPRPTNALNIFDLADLPTLLRKDKTLAKETLLMLREEAGRVRTSIHEEMRKRYGFRWDVWIGFHAVPSMLHLHLHVISSDLCSPTLKHKKHYNSFHPKLGFFLHLEDVLGWFDAEPSYYKQKSQLKKSQYEPLLKEDLVCLHCESPMKNMPTLKAHLQEEWETQRRRLARKRKTPDEVTPEPSTPSKKVASELEAPDGNAVPSEPRNTVLIPAQPPSHRTTLYDYINMERSHHHLCTL
ncbi:HIT-like domain-containing protein [Amylostereum chailletii]|nr:HIT-like domain-containing protein [Amylostereum chailletii]